MSIKVMTQVWEHSEQEGGKLLVLLALADHANDRGYCWPSVTTLAKKARLSVRHVRRILSELEESGELSVEHRHGTSNYYRVMVSQSGGDKMAGVEGGQIDTPDADVTPTPDADVTPPLTPASPKPSCNHHGNRQKKTTNDAGASLSSGEKPPPNLRGWLELLRNSKNKAATSRYMIQTLYPYFGDGELPDYGRIGKTSKRVGGWARLIQYIWGVNQHEPQGDLMSYIEAVHRSRAKPTNNGKYRMEVGA